MALTSKLTNIADAIREKTGESGTLTLDAMAAAIAGIEAGGGDVSVLGYNVLNGSFTLSEDMTSGNYDVYNEYLSTERGEYAVFIFMDSSFFPYSGSVKSFIWGASAPHKQYQNYAAEQHSVIGYSMGNGSNPVVKTSGMGNFGAYSNGMLRVSIPTSDANLIAGVTYNWVIFYK